MKDQILELYGRKIGKRKIARMLGISKNTVKGVIHAAAAGPRAVSDVPAAPADEAAWATQVRWDTTSSKPHFR